MVLINEQHQSQGEQQSVGGNNYDAGPSNVLRMARDMLIGVVRTREEAELDDEVYRERRQALDRSSQYSAPRPKAFLQGFKAKYHAEASYSAAIQPVTRGCWFTPYMYKAEDILNDAVELDVRRNKVFSAAYQKVSAATTEDQMVAFVCSIDANNIFHPVDWERVRTQSMEWMFIIYGCLVLSIFKNSNEANFQNYMGKRVKAIAAEIGFALAGDVVKVPFDQTLARIVRSKFGSSFPLLIHLILAHMSKNTSFGRVSKAVTRCSHPQFFRYLQPEKDQMCLSRNKFPTLFAAAVLVKSNFSRQQGTLTNFVTAGGDAYVMSVATDIARLHVELVRKMARSTTAEHFISVMFRDFDPDEEE
ncbi:hypothetical protein P3L10_031551 [Capsicum annuum]